MVAGDLRPLVFLDIDGVLIPLRARSSSAPHPHDSIRDGAHHGCGNPLLERLAPGDGQRLRALPGQLVWASTWMAEANEVVAPRLGLPALPVVDWSDADEQPPHGIHWKTEPLTRWAAGRPFVWLDDETTDADQQWVAAHHPKPALLHRVDACLGLTDADFSATRRWLEQNDRTG